MVTRCYPGGKAKAFNVTYDDGILQDVRFVALLNKYGLKGTFNLNSKLMEQEFEWIHPSGMTVKRLSPDAAEHLYDGHEIAAHTLTHPFLNDKSEEELMWEIGEDACVPENSEITPGSVSGIFCASTSVRSISIRIIVGSS